MKILHISAECYPAAKAGGLGDVVGALPKYLCQAGLDTAVIIPKYFTRWMMGQEFEEVFRGAVRLHHQQVFYAIEKYSGDDLGFPLYVVHVPGKFDRPGVYADPGGYGYGDETERYLCFQQAVLQWVISLPERPSVLHCHDHHTGLIPFMVKHCQDYQALADTPTVFTIHNGVYHGAFSWEKMYLLPFFDGRMRGLLDWANTINPLAAAIKCCWRLTTVSQSYLEELRVSSGLEWLLVNEAQKSVGIINGIDNKVWDPKKDPYLPAPLKRSVPKFKAANRAALQERFNVDPDLPLITFIGRLVREKGADLLPDLINRFLSSGHRASFVILGTGEAHLHRSFESMRYHFHPYFDAALEYNEGLAHTLYAGSDFLLMPSRVEPCGLNQMYAMRYGAVPIVRKIGGLKDTVIDIGDPDGRGLTFTHLSVDDAFLALHRAMEVYQDQDYFKKLRTRIMKVDFSWERSAAAYGDIYQQLGTA